MCDPGAAPKCEDTPHKGRVWSLSCTFWKRLLKKTRVNLNPPLRPALCNKVPGFVSLPMNSFATRALARELLLPCGTFFVAVPPGGGPLCAARSTDFRGARICNPYGRRASRLPAGWAGKSSRDACFPHGLQIRATDGVSTAFGALSRAAGRVGATIRLR